MTFPEVVKIVEECLKTHEPPLNVKEKRPPGGTLCERHYRRYLSHITTPEVVGLVEELLNAPELKNRFVVHEPPESLPGATHDAACVASKDMIVKIAISFDRTTLSDFLQIACWYSKD